MRFILSLLLAVILSSTLLAQIEVGVETLPDVGDILEYQSFQHIGDTMSYRATGNDLQWTYDNIVADSVEFETYLDITGTVLGDSFPQANMVINLGGFESAAVRTDNTIEVVGVSGGLFGLFGGGAPVFQDPFLIKQVPINMGDKFEDAVSLPITFSSDIIPGLDTITLPLPGATIDSIRLSITLTKTEEAMAWGNLDLIGQSHDVLKIVSIDETSTTIELGLNVFGNIIWFDASALLGMSFDFGNQRTITHKFLSADSKESIIEFAENRVTDTFGNSQVFVNGRIKSSLVTSVNDINPAEHIELSPNPTTGDVVIRSLDGNRSTYSLNVVDELGRMVFEQIDYQTGDKVNLGFLTQGTYSILLNNGKTTSSIRLVKI